MPPAFAHVPVAELAVKLPFGNPAVLGWMPGPGKLWPDQLGIVGVQVPGLAGIEKAPVVKQTPTDKAYVAGFDLLEVYVA